MEISPQRILIQCESVYCNGMMLQMPNDDEDFEIVPIPIDRETLRRLKMLADFVGDHPVRCASSLLHDIMMDDFEANANALGASGGTVQ